MAKRPAAFYIVRPDGSRYRDSAGTTTFTRARAQPIIERLCREIAKREARTPSGGPLRMVPEVYLVPVE